jgi:DNA-binding beta-propeller fold protein YncE
LEAKYPGALVIIGVHSPKFPHEKETASIRKAILRYNVDHPVVNDSNLALWRRFGVNSWPTYVLIDPAGRVRTGTGGEGKFRALDGAIASLVREFRGKSMLKTTPLKFALEREQITSPLFFPGKVLADAASNRIFIADSSNNRIVITDLAGKKIAVAGTGKEGKMNGPFAQATFSDPQGLALDGNLLYVADRKNHLIRSLDLKTQTVKTIAGNGVQDRTLMPTYRARPALTNGLNSPWGLLLHQKRLYIGMAGHHQIWALDLNNKYMGPFAGDGDENIKDSTFRSAKFAQPSGIGSDGVNLYVADSEVSGIRALRLDGSGYVNTIVGAGLFEFGDSNGQGMQVRLQHALDVAYYKGKLYVADTYNHKIKLIDPAQRTCTTFLGDTAGTFDEPSGLSFSGNKLYVADTAAHRIRVVDMDTRAISTLELQGVESPVQAASRTPKVSAK